MKSARTVALLALCTALMVAAQVSMQFLPNIELVSLLVILFTLAFRRKVLYIIYTFAVLEGVIFGFDPWWWTTYLYIWTILAFLTWLFRDMESPLFWAVLSGIFGLFFGALGVIPYLITGGPVMALGKLISGLLFDLVHCAGNFALCLILWKPLRDALALCTKRFIVKNENKV